jgi:phosphoesterase RecJ-like protein
LSLEQAVQWIREKDDFLLTTHSHPDGDGLGSQAALYLALRHLGKKVRMVNADTVPRCYRWLPCTDSVEVSSQIPPHQACIIVDVGELHRVREGAKREEFGPLLNIDHHSSGTPFGDVNWVDPTAAATGEMIYRLVRELGVPIDKPIAESLYTTIVTDTGGFRYSNTTAHVMRLAAELMDAGADAHAVCERVFSHIPRAAFEMVRLSLATLRTHLDGRVGLMTLSHADFLRSGAKDEDTDGLVNYARKLDGVEVAVFLKERGDGYIRVSFRSRNGLDVGKVAAGLGGGGHKYASGATVQGALEETADRVVAVLTEALTKKNL